MGSVANFICFSQQRKNFESQLRYDKVTENFEVGTSFETQCRMMSINVSIFNTMVAGHQILCTFHLSNTIYKLLRVTNENVYNQL